MFSGCSKLGLVCSSLLVYDLYDFFHTFSWLGGWSSVTQVHLSYFLPLDMERWAETTHQALAGAQSASLAFLLFCHWGVCKSWSRRRCILQAPMGQQMMLRCSLDSQRNVAHVDRWVFCQTPATLHSAKVTLCFVAANRSPAKNCSLLIFPKHFALVTSSCDSSF